VFCDKCGRNTSRVTPTYWSGWKERLCPLCCERAVKKRDVEGWEPTNYEKESNEKK
jgi:hypothetical protein